MHTSMRLSTVCAPRLIRPTMSSTAHVNRVRLVNLAWSALPKYVQMEIALPRQRMRCADISHLPLFGLGQNSSIKVRWCVRSECRYPAVDGRMEMSKDLKRISWHGWARMCHGGIGGDLFCAAPPHSLTFKVVVSLRPRLRQLHRPFAHCDDDEQMATIASKAMRCA